MTPAYRAALLRAIVAASGFALPAGAGAVSEAAAPSMILPPDARACAMGQSGVTTAVGASAMYWNPALLAGLEGLSLDLMPRNQLIPSLASDVYFWYSGAAWETSPRRLVVGLQFTYLTYGRWTATNPEGVSLGEYESHEYVAGVSCAGRLNRFLRAGGSLKYVKESLVPEAINDLEKGVGSSWALDAGLLFSVWRDRVRAGVALQNLGPKLAFVDADQKAPLPTNFRAGVGLTVPVAAALGLPRVPLLDAEPLRLTWTAERNVPVPDIFDDWAAAKGRMRRLAGRDVSHNRGWEVTILELFSVRRGFIEDPDGDIRGATDGYGISTPRRWRLHMSYDRATVPKARGIGEEKKCSWTAGMRF